MASKNRASSKFDSFGLIEPVVKVLQEIGYEKPTPIQEQMIPHIMEGRDVLGQAQTGTGKTAAFALPILSRLDVRVRAPQVLVLAPTRELAIQVSESFEKYAAHLKDFHVVPIYGGQAYKGQLLQLKRGVHVVVGTPGRVMDHMRRKTLKLKDLSCLVLDEADEMLRMGFIEDVEWILEQTPEDRQIALFSATMPKPIRKIANTYLKNPMEVMIESRVTSAVTIRQRYWNVSGFHKLDALTRVLEFESYDGVIVFVRTKTATIELSENLAARGFACEPLNGDIPQKQRERTIDRLKAGKLDILVATDVAARGLDVKRISLVINYDIPHDAEAYVHRIGRTGRAGKRGDAILFVSPRERRILQSIESATKKPLELMDFPTTHDINQKRIADFKQRITTALAGEGLDIFRELVDQYRQECHVPPTEIAAALALMVQDGRPLLLKKEPKGRKAEFERKADRKPDRKQKDGKVRAARLPGEGKERYRVEVGHEHGVKPGNLVGAIANEGGLNSSDIGAISIQESHSLIDLPENVSRHAIRILKDVSVCGRQLRISKLTTSGISAPFYDDRKKGKSKGSYADKGKGKGKGKSKGYGVAKLEGKYTVKEKGKQKSNKKDKEKGKGKGKGKGKWKGKQD